MRRVAGSTVLLLFAAACTRANPDYCRDNPNRDCQLDAPPSDFSVEVTVSGTGTGRVTSTPPGIDCPSSCTASFPTGTNVTLTAAPDAAAAFAGFSGECTGLTKSCALTVDTNKAVSARFALSGEKRFAKQIESKLLSAVATTDGNVIVAGELPLTSGKLAAYVSLRSGNDGAVIWEATIPGDATASSGLTTPMIALAPTGNVVLAAGFRGTPILGGRTLANAGGTDFLVAELAASTGAVIWVKEFGGDRSDVPHGLAVAPNGTIYVTGAFDSTSVVMGSTTLTNASSSTPFNNDAFVAALTFTGGMVWAKSFGAAAGSESAVGAAADTQSNVLITCNFSGASVYFGGAGYMFTPAGGDGAALKLRESDGFTLWARQFGGPNSDSASAITSSSNGGIVVSGSFGSSQSFGGPTVMWTGANDVYVASYTTGGSYVAAYGFGAATGNEIALEVRVDSTGGLVLVGAFDGPTTQFGSLPFNNAGSSDAYVLKVNPAGVPVWAYRFGGGQLDIAQGLTVDPWDAVFVVGSFRADADVAGETFSTAETDAGFLVSYWP